MSKFSWKKLLILKKFWEFVHLYDYFIWQNEVYLFQDVIKSAKIYFRRRIIIEKRVGKFLPPAISFSKILYNIILESVRNSRISHFHYKNPTNEINHSIRSPRKRATINFLPRPPFFFFSRIARGWAPFWKIARLKNRGGRCMDPRQLITPRSCRDV